MGSSLLLKGKIAHFETLISPAVRREEEEEEG